jgi:hypothetical protein
MIHARPIFTPGRVTRLGEFSPVGWLSLGKFLKITEEAQIVGLLISKEKVMY